MALQDKRLFLLDMDGTIYLSEQLFDGTIDFLNYVKRIGGRYLFLTNNSSRGTEAYIEKMARMGIEAFPEDFLTSADAAVDYFHQNPPKGTIYVCGTESLKGQLRAAGLAVAEAADEQVSTVLLGYDTELTYQKLEDCCILLGRGADYIATHPDMVCPTWYGSVPDCGSVCQMLTRATGREPVFVGKPRPDMVRLAMERTGFSEEETVVVGDRLYTDVACGVNAGVDTVFVLSGEGTCADIERFDIHPTWVLQDIAAICREMEENR